MIPKLIVTDIDGVWTDGGMYYDNLENELKKFNTYDSAGVLFAKCSNIPVAIITGEDTNIVKRRAKKLKIEHLFLGVNDKLDCLTRLCEDLNIDLQSVAFIGDDLNDIEVFTKAGITGCPSSAPIYIRQMVNYVCTKKGGEGAFREFVEYLLNLTTIQRVVDLLKSSALL